MSPASRYALCVTLALCGCAGPPPPRLDTGLDGLAVTSIDPGVVLPGTTLVITGQSFVDDALGSSTFHFDGTLGGNSVTVDAPARYVSLTRLEIPVDASFLAALGSHIDGALQGTFTISVLSTIDGTTHSVSMDTTLQMQSHSTPALSSIPSGALYVNDLIPAVGTGYLLGGAEGTTSAHVSGCFTPDGATNCSSPIDIEIVAAPATEFDRTRVQFPYVTAISGIGSGSFVGRISMINRVGAGSPLESDPVSVAFQIRPPVVTGISTPGASLGQYVTINGGGFVGGANTTDESTVLELVGIYTDRSQKVTQLDVVIVPEFVGGPTLRYVLDEGDALGALLDYRKSAGTIVGTIRATMQKGSTKIESGVVPITLQILPIKQVVYLNFLDSYVFSLRLFGLRAADDLIRKRTFAISNRIYQTLNVEFRNQAPTDFALFATVDLGGPDPNGQGLLGYDNTPGKDVGNLRLYDHIGGINATTQSDGYAGFGGVFTEAFFEFSTHPKTLATMTAPDAAFDEIFDPFRPDVGGQAVTADELARLQPDELTSGDTCPASDRRGQISCAVWTLGNLIGSSMTHELGHSFGLADPFGPATTFHNVGDLPDRLMEVGDARPFGERALLGDGPAEFCTDEYTYLRGILAADTDPTTYDRASCD